MNNSSQIKWSGFAVTASEDAVEAVEFGFNELGASATSIDHLKKRTGETVEIHGFFEETPQIGEVEKGISEALRIYGLDASSVSDIRELVIENTDWLAEWKKHWKPTTIGRFVIAPPWEDVSDAEKIIIKIEPNMAFGTGTHETTQLCLSAIDNIYTTGSSVLDIGTGTGILAIAAAKMNDGINCEISGCDTDVDSISIAIENAELNDVGDKIEFSVGSIDERTKPAEFVFANLTIDVILPILTHLIALTGKYLILSGILTEQREMIEKALRGHALQTFTIEQKGEWIAVVVSFSTTS